MTKFSEKIRILLVDDEQDALDAMRLSLSADASTDILTSNSRNSAINLIKNENLDIVVTDLKLRDGTGLDIVNFIQEHKPYISIIIVTAYGSINTAVQAIRSGAYDYLQKPIRMADLKRTIQRLRENILLRRENEKLRKQLDNRGAVFHLIGTSPKFRQVIEFVNQVAQAQSTILITGESGTGKEVVADAIQGKSSRKDKPFIKINCGAIPENLLESELFGYEKGAFTGAVKQKKGKIELAHEGTLFLDEIGELPKSMQVKLLRVLQNGEFERLGGTSILKADIRLIAATNSDLSEMVREGLFREDLYYRLDVISINLPPLRERLEDLPLLLQYFIEKYNTLNNKQIEGLEPEILREMNRYMWRGNIRELENMIERAVVLSPDKILKLHHFPALHLNKPEENMMQSYEVGQTMEEIEKNAILKTLQFHDFDKSKTAMTLQIGLATLYRKLKQFGIDV
jgi:DNA-binding NtrC family response regulator